MAGAWGVAITTYAIAPSDLQGSVEPAVAMDGDAIAVIVAARNYGVYVRETFRSIMRQTRKPAEVVYVDDGSTDDSVEVANDVLGVNVLSLPHGGVVVARNAGLAATRAPLVVHVDGDDVLPNDFLERHHAALRSAPNAGFAYGPAQAFGDHASHWGVPAWDRDRLWRRNWVNTSAMYRRSAIDAVGGWRDGIGTAWDWDLALRVSRHASGVASDATLLYRQHDGSWSHRSGEKGGPKEVEAIFRGVREQCARVCICVAYSGRLMWSTYIDRWMDGLVEACRDMPVTPSLAVLDLSPHRSSHLMMALSRMSGDFRDIRYRRQPTPWRFEREDADARAKLVGDACNTLLEMAGEDEIAWFVEDDIIPPAGSGKRLLSQLCHGAAAPQPAVAGLYRNRHDPTQYVAHNCAPRHGWDRLTTLLAPPREPEQVDFTGTGCLMIFRPEARHRFCSHVRGAAAHDWAWCDELREATGRRVLIDPAVQCRHYQNSDVYV